MSSACRASAAAALLALALSASGAWSKTLRVCLDPNSLPYSNRAGEGFENLIAARVAQAIGRDFVPVWRPHRGHGFFRKTLGAGACDALAGVPVGVPEVATTRPYYRSSYVFVSLAARGLDVTSFDDPRLAGLRIGVPVFGEGLDTPPVAALGQRGVVARLRPYEVEGDFGTPDWQGRLVAAVARGDVDLAIAWGPPAGYFAAREGEELRLVPTPARDGPHLPLAFDMAMAVAPGNDALRAELDAALARLQTEIDAILARFRVVRVEAPP